MSQTAQPDYLRSFVAIYKKAPSLAIWRAFEARAFDKIVLEPPTLDLACGTGHFARILLQSKTITGCDLDEKAIRVAANEKSLTTVSVADARALPYPDESFNSVLGNCALEHIREVEQAISEVARVLKPMGLFAFTVPSEYFNQSLLFPRLYRIVGLHSRARRHLQWYNSMQQHIHIDPISVWEKRLDTAGFKLILHRYYMPRRASSLFSLWDVTAKWTISLGRSKSIPVQEFFLNRVPTRILFWILYSHLVQLYRSPSNADTGSGLLVVARKKIKRC